jgi:NAD(P)H-hydrate epimerase
VTAPTDDLVDAALRGAYEAAAVRAAEAPLLADGAPLMRRAAHALSGIVTDIVTADPALRVLVLAGGGDNGGDALFAAAEIAGHAPVDVVLTSDHVHREAFAAATAAGARVCPASELRAQPTGRVLIVDGILGLGTSADTRLRGVARAVVEGLLPAVRAGDARVVAVDLPSGLHPDDGTADDVVLPAETTVTFGAVKAGLVRGRGPELAGDIRLVDLGLGPHLARARPAVTGPVRAIRAQRA